jgi:glutathione S-transferase
MEYHLAIGDRSHSSWSLRAWLMFARFGLPVSLHAAPLYTPGFAALLAGFGGARTVPALRIEEPGGASLLWDSRALARSMVAEMHAGFFALREACPMNLRRAYVGFAPGPEVRKDMARVEALWAMAPGEGWLFGDYSLGDVFFAPVAARIATYGLEVGPAAAAYVAAHLAEPRFLEWRAAGLAEPHPQPVYDLDLPERPWPGPAAA